MVDHLLAFTHIAKTAGTTLHHILRRTYGTGYTVVSKRYSPGTHVDGDDVARLRRRYRNLRGIGGHLVLPRGDLIEAEPGIRFITMLRDPIMRCASHYAHDVRRERTTLSVSEWLRQDRKRDHQTRRIAGVPDADAAVEVLDQHFLFVGLVERFPESLVRLAALLPELALPPRDVHHNPNPLRDVRDEVLADPAARAEIVAANREDTRLYEHVRSHVWPRPVGAAPDSGAPPEWRAAARARLSLAKERLLLGVPRQLAKAGVTLGDPL